jgi:hypothetical protein
MGLTLDVVPACLPLLDVDAGHPIDKVPCRILTGSYGDVQRVYHLPVATTGLIHTKLGPTSGRMPKQQGWLHQGYEP